MPEKRLTVVTYNIHKGFSPGNRRFVLHQIRTALLSVDADVLFLQEMQGEHQGHEQRINDWPDCAQVEFLAKEAWPHYAYSKNATYSNGHHGNAILSKFPLLSWENINVSSFRQASRSLLHGVIDTPKTHKPIHIICIHFGLFAIERQRQIAILCDRIDSHVPHDAPLIVAGDFNDWTCVAEDYFSKHLNLQEAFYSLHSCRPRTFPAWLPFLSVDRIYYRGLQPLSCERLMHAPWRNLSDHVPMIATFQL
ncbi:endonuclease/exonuclease/phosphatase family protein [Crenothrix sp.]|uniref:endonuclease/exonuclease/phosphatase family protein n=1 Tax=Crenothrix sp. TaxID=3100433 RepID=UPI00374CF36E